MAKNHEGWMLNKGSPLTAGMPDGQRATVSGHRRPMGRGERPKPALAGWIVASVLMLLSGGCHHRSQQPSVPPPPTLGGRQSNAAPSERAPIPLPKGRPDFVETGMASWYAPSGHRAADGSYYDGAGMTAAHKTLPLETIVRVTNLSNNKSVLVRITDRGPFVHGRIIDLSESAAKKIDLYRMGVARVRVEAYLRTSPATQSNWCVQTGVFPTRKDALDLKRALLRRYAGSQVIEFTGATGYWVRIRPARPDRAEAVAIMEWIGRPFPHVVPYLVRLN